MTQLIWENAEALGGRLHLPETRQEFPEDGEGGGWSRSKGEGMMQVSEGRDT